MKRPKGVRLRRCRCGKVPFYSEESAVYNLQLAQKQALLDKERKERRVYLCPVANGPVWHLTSMTEARHQKRQTVWARATVWTCGVRGMPSTVLTPEQMRGRVNTNPWRARVVVRITVRKRKQEPE